MDEETKKTNQVIDELTSGTRTIKATSGVEITLPKLYYGSNLKLNKLMSELIDVTKDTLLNLMNETDETKLDKLFEMMAIYTGKPIDWLKENFDISDVIAELQLFFGIVRYAKTTRKMQEFQKMVSLLTPSGN